MSRCKAFCVILLLCLNVSVLSDPPGFAGGVPLGFVTHTDLMELSGLAASRHNPGILWTHNDGSQGRVYAIGTNGQLLATFQVSQDIDDFEEITLGPGPRPELTYLYIGDIGDNLSNRATFRVYRTGEPAVYSHYAGAPISRSFQSVEQFTFAYPDGSYDTEAFFCDPKTGDLYFTTKQPLTSVYRAEAAQLQTSMVITCSYVRTVFFSEPSAATTSPDGSEIILRQESYARLWQRDAVQTIDEALAGNPLIVPIIGRPQEPNGESIAYHPTGLGYYTLSEGANQPIYYFAKTSGFIPPQPVMLIPPASDWRFLDNGSDQATAWRNPGFNDAGWRSGRGQFGYGDGDEQTLVSYGLSGTLKHVTTYFRKSFTIADPGLVESLALTAVFDDAAAIYINGTEVLRSNLVANAGYATAAINTGNALENLWQRFAVTNVLVAGTNVIAVEVHRNSRSEGTLSFDLQLEAILRPQPIEFTSAPVGLPDGIWVLNMRGPGDASITVEGSTDLSSWTEVGSYTLPPSGVGSFTNAPTDSPWHFFRAVRTP
jgi:hypothetical protein